MDTRTLTRSSVLYGCMALAQACGGQIDGTDPSAVSSAYSSWKGEAAQLLALTVRPIAIGHEGDGENQGTDPTKPINDTLAAVKLAYSQGARVVEVDAQITADGQMVAYHDTDYLPDYTCIASLTLAQMKARVPTVATLSSVLWAAREVASDCDDRGPCGVMIVELKPASPLCDPNDTRDPLTVAAAISVVRQTGTWSQVIFDSFSPTLLQLAKAQAPQIPGELDFDVLQLLTPAQVAAETGLTVTLINRTNNLGLQWADIGPVYRLPGYTSIQQFLGTVLGIGSSIAGARMDFVGFAEQSQPGSTAALVSTIHSLGLKAFIDTAVTAADWNMFAGMGFDAIYADNVPLAVSLQPRIPYSH